MRLTDRVAAALDRRLDPQSKAPLAVALSGGGDSVALLALALDWARPRGRPVLALTVDHGLNPDSAAWTEFAARVADQLGASHQALAWTGPKPATGLPAAARAAGAGVILTGHTADDVHEGDLMRAEGSSLGTLREWAPSPAWPEGRGVFLLRPLLTTARAELRDLLRDRGLDWIEDPANEDPRFARARARFTLSAHPGASRGSGSFDGANRSEDKSRDERVGELARAALFDDAGGLTIPRTTFREAEPLTVRAFLGAALLCVAGGTRPPRGARLERLLVQALGHRAFAATLAGARVEGDENHLRIHREPGETARGGLSQMPLAPGGASVWDGRFEIVAEQPCQVRPLKGLAARLDPADRAAISGLPAVARPGLPVLLRDGAARPVLAARGARVRALARPRLLAACGLIAHERENGVSAHGVFNFASLCSGSETPPVPGDHRSRS